MEVTDLPPPDSPKRPPLRPLYGIPEPERRSNTGLIVSGLLHALIIVALLLPPLVARQLAEPEAQGAGGAGPAGGGGGGTNGSGGELKPEGIRFLQMAPAPAPAPSATQERPTPTPPPPPPEPEPEPEETPEPVPEVPQRASSETPPTLGPTKPIPGMGGGSGNDGSGGMGPGSGGGIGSGVGTGTGSANGPGTGGGGDEIFPPTVTNLAILPIPVPNRVRPYKLIAQFEVDEKGNAKLLAFNPSKDRGYNRKIREMLNEVRFRPAVRANGTPVKDTAYITAEAP